MNVSLAGYFAQCNVYGIQYTCDITDERAQKAYSSGMLCAAGSGVYTRAETVIMTVNLFDHAAVADMAIASQNVAGAMSSNSSPDTMRADMLGVAI